MATYTKIPFFIIRENYEFSLHWFHRIVETHLRGWLIQTTYGIGDPMAATAVLTDRLTIIYRRAKNPQSTNYMKLKSVDPWLIWLLNIVKCLVGLLQCIDAQLGVKGCLA